MQHASVSEVTMLLWAHVMHFQSRYVLLGMHMGVSTSGAITLTPCWSKGLTEVAAFSTAAAAGAAAAAVLRALVNACDPLSC